MSDENPDTDDYKPPSRVKAVGLGALIFVAIVVVFGFAGKLAGTGWFGHRAFLYGDGELYALNMSDTPLWVSVDGRERVEVKIQNAQLFELIGGTSEVIVTDKSGEVVGRYKVTTDHSNAFLKLTDDGCLAVTQLDPFYSSGAKQDINIEAMLKPETRVWIPGSKNVVWPRKPFPTRLSAGQGRGLWVELVGCSLLEEPKFLDAYLAFRLEERVKKAKGGDKKADSKGQK